MRPAQLDGTPQHGEEPEEHRDLDQDRQAAAHRVDLVLPHERHDPLVHLLRIVLVLFADLSHLRLIGSHALHGDRACPCERPKQNLDDDGDYDDAKSVAKPEAVKAIHRFQKNRGEDAEKPAKAHHGIDRVFVCLAVGLEDLVFLRAGVGDEFLNNALAGLQHFGVKLKAGQDAGVMDVLLVLILRIIQQGMGGFDRVNPAAGCSLHRHGGHSEKPVVNPDPVDRLLPVRNELGTRRPREAAKRAVGEPTLIDVFHVRAVMPLGTPDRIAPSGLKRHGGAQHQFPLRQRNRLRLRVGQCDC